MKKIIPVLLALTLLFTGCSSEPSPTTSEKNTDVEQIIYEDSTLKAVYKGVSDQGVMTVSLENKADDEITILPMDSSVDGEMIQFTSGTLATIQPGKTFNQGWIIGSVPTENIEFSMSICDKDMSEITKTDPITIEME